MAPPRSEFDREMMVLEAEIKRLEAEYNMFFTGRIQRPPFETRKRVDAVVKKHDRSYIQNTADRFRFSSVQSRFAKLCEVWEKQLNAHEYGRPKRGGALGATYAARPAADAVPDRDAAKPPTPAAGGERLLHVASIRDAADGNQVRELYEHLAEARKATGEAPVALDRVAALVKAQIDKHRADGCEVAFRVAMKDGKVLLTVKAVKDGE